MLKIYYIFKFFSNLFINIKREYYVVYSMDYTLYILPIVIVISVFLSKYMIETYDIEMIPTTLTIFIVYMTSLISMKIMKDKTENNCNQYIKSIY